MKYLRSLLCLLLVAVMLVGCTPTSPDETKPAELQLHEMTLDQRLEKYAQLGTSPDDNYRTWYEIFVYSYCDSNGDGIGDLNGVRSKLDELEELGVNGIWLMPIHPSSSYHKYNVNDYYDIDRSYGTMADFDALIADCNSRGIKVILDLVINHSGAQNEWFTTACDYLRNLMWGETPDPTVCPYVDYYNFVLSEDAPSKGFNKVSGSEYHYECQFDSQMPDLKLENEELRSDISDIMKFWLDKGVAGFRVDAAKEFYTGNIDKNVEFMSWLQQTATSLKSDAYMVAEVWDKFPQVTRYYESGFISIFNYPFGNYDGKLCQVLNGRGNAGMVNTWATAQVTCHEAYGGNNPTYIDAPFLSNHDVGRIYGFVSGDEVRVKMAGAMNLFMSGGTFIYYGEEIGMVGTDTDNDPTKRAPMYWNAERNNGTTNAPPGCTLPASYPLGSLAEQKEDDSSVYNYYREAIAIRNALPVISHGVVSVETALNKGCVSAVRKTWNDQECIILENIDKKAAAVDLSAYADWDLVAILSADGEPISMDGTTLNMAACGIAVLIPSK